MIRAAALAAALVLAAIPARSGPLVFTWSVASVGHQHLVEQQTPGGANQPDPSLWVVNPTECVWDADDDRTWDAGGNLTPGTAANAAGCIIGDTMAHIVSVVVRAPRPGLGVAISLVGDGLRFTLPATVSEWGRGWVYRACLLGPDYRSGVLGSLPLVEGSNGGHGVRWAAAVSVVNPTGRTVRDVAGSFRIGYYVGPGDNGCNDPYPISLTGERINWDPGIWAG